MSKVPEWVVKQAQDTDLVALLGRYNYHFKRASDKSGPCPFCKGGEDRFWVKDNRYKCRKCGVHGTPVDFVMSRERVGFVEAVSMLTNYVVETAPNGVQDNRGYKQTAQPAATQSAPAWGSLSALPVAAPTKRKEPPSAEWIAEATGIAEDCHRRLLADDAGQPGRDYLIERAISLDAWLAFRLGYHPAIPVPGQGESRPAICVPWLRGGKVLAIRYRFLKPFEEPKADGSTRKRKITSKKGSYFTGYVYGGHALPDFVSPDCGVLNQRTLIIHEGELNAISSWQVVRGWRWDVLSVGGENEAEHLPQGVVDFALKYERVMCWMDRPEIVKAAMAQIPGSCGINSPIINGKKADANDILKAGHLGGILADARHKACKTDAERTRLFYALWDAFTEGALDDVALGVMGKLSDSLGLTTAG